MKLKHACVDAGQYGLNISPEEYRSDGVRLIRTSDLRPHGLADANDGIFVRGPVDARFVIETHDILLSRAGTIGRSFLVPPAAAGSTFAGFLVRFRPVANSDPRFLNYAIQSQPVQGAISSDAITSTIQNFNADRYANLEIPEIELESQRRIADFLDDRIARLDRTIEARRQQNRHAHETLDAVWAQQSDSHEASFGLVPLRRFLVSIADGPFGSSLTSSHYADSGTRVIRLGNIGIAAFRGGDEAFVSSAYGDKLSAHAARQGDLIMAGLGDDRWPLGRCAVVPADVAPAIVKADCYRIRLDSRIRHDYAAMFLSSPPARQRAMLLGRGATRARLNTDIARASQLPPATAQAQQEYVAAINLGQDVVLQSVAMLERSITLLAEYKSTLVTAAVTGELDVTTVGSGIPG